MSDLINLMPRKLIYCDVGAGALGARKPWKTHRSLFKSINFEPTAERLSKLIRKTTSGDDVHACGIYSKRSDLDFHYCGNGSGTANSFLPVDIAFRNQFPQPEIFEQTHSKKMKVYALDNLPIGDVDFCKIIVNGAEMDVLEGGLSTLNNIVGLEMASEFRPLWLGESRFSEIDIFIRKHFGLEIQDIERHYYKYNEGVGYGSSKGQLVYGTMLYFRPPADVVRMGEEKAIMAVVMGVVYGYADYALKILSLIPNTEPSSCFRLQKLEELVKHHFKGFTIPEFKGKGRIFEVLELLAWMFRPANGWKYQDTHRGNRKKYGVWC